MIEKFKTSINQEGLIYPSDKILVAVSGGLDSMVLVHLLHQLQYDTTVAHCNFQLRERESDEDEEFVRKHCSQIDVPFISKRFDTNNYASENKLSTQMAARNLRYDWFYELLNEFGFTKLAMAHHFNDSIETVILNWVKGGGIESLQGIKIKRLPIIRPLLLFTRDEINDYAAEHQIKWREDSSNITINYQRNFIRHQVIPQLKRLNISLEKTLLESSRKVEGELSFFNDAFERWKNEFVSFQNQFINIDKRGLSSSFGASVLYHFVKQFGFSFHDCEEMMSGLNGQSGKKYLSSTHQLVIDRDKLIISFLSQELEQRIITREDHLISLGEQTIIVSKKKNATISVNPEVAVVDAEKIEFPLTWRKWKPGDFFYPLGMKHRKKLSDFLIDNKVNSAEKDAITVLESNGQVVWVVGYRIDERYKIDANTKSVISFEVHPHL